MRKKEQQQKQLRTIKQLTKRWCSRSLLLILLVGLGLGGCTELPKLTKAKQQVIEQSNQLLAENKTGEADQLITELLAEPENQEIPEIQAQKGYLALLLENPTVAITSLEKARQKRQQLVYPEDIQAILLNLGIAYRQKGQADKAIERLNELLEEYPEESLAYAYRGLSYADKHELNKGLSDLNTALNISPEMPKLYYLKADFFSGQRQWEEALAVYGQAIVKWPEEGAFYLRRGDIYYQKADYSRAMQDYGIALKTYPLVAYQSMGYGYMRLEQYTDAIDSFSRYLDLLAKTDLSAVYEMGVAWYHLQRYDKALASMDLLLTDAPDNKEALLMKGLILEKKEELVAAKKIFEEVLSHYPEDETAQQEVAYIKRQLNESNK